MSALVPSDPSEIGFDPNLPLELALGEAEPKEVCRAYGVTATEWRRLRVDPVFIQAVEEAHAVLSQEGAMFKAKIKAQAQGILGRNWHLIHASNELVPASVQADLIKFTVRAAGLDASVEQKARAQGSANPTNALQINFIMGDTP